MWLGRAPRKFKTPGPSFCWHCNKQLMAMKGGVLSFSIVVDKADVEHRVHKACVREVTADGDVRLKPT